MGWAAIQASMWGALKVMGVAGARPGYGRLMADVEADIPLEAPVAADSL